MKSSIQRQYYFIRHAVPQSDEGSFHLSRFERDMRGEADHALSPQGRSQAARLARVASDIGIDRVVSSRLARAEETASILAQGAGLPLDPPLAELNEIAPGDLPLDRPLLATLRLARRAPAALHLGDSLRSALSIYYLVMWRLGRTRHGDAVPEMRRRVCAALEALDRRPEGDRVAVVGHGYWILFLALEIAQGGWLNLARVRWVANCSVTRIDSDRRGGYRLVSFARNLT